MLSKELYDRDILSLRTGEVVGTALRPVINPNNLKIIGWWCKVIEEKDIKVLLSEDVRELLTQGLAINDINEFTLPDDLVRHREILELDFTLEAKPVKTKSTKLGKVADYSFNDGYFVQKLYVEPPIIKALGSDTLVIDRTQIIEITDRYIVVKDTEVKAGTGLRLPKLAAKFLGGAPSSAQSSLRRTRVTKS